MNKQLKREEIYEPGIQDQVDNAPLTIMEQLAEIKELAQELEKLTNTPILWENYFYIYDLEPK